MYKIYCTPLFSDSEFVLFENIYFKGNLLGMQVTLFKFQTKVLLFRTLYHLLIPFKSFKSTKQ